MKIKKNAMRYPLPEKIGDPSLFVGRAKEFKNFNRWLDKIPKRISKSRVILARRKSGKTAFVQRIFNQLWSQNGMVIPFYFNIGENQTWYPDFAIDYYQTFVTQYISFLERDESLLVKVLTMAEIKSYAESKPHDLLLREVEAILSDKERGSYDLVWKRIYSAPHRYAAILDIRFLVILDEFQNIAQYIYRDEACQTAHDETMAGSFHDVVESKLAPMLVTGSYVGWLISIIDKYLEAGRLTRIRLAPYLTPEEGLEAVYRYAEVNQEPITNETALQINQLCMADPFFISCVMESNYEGRDLLSTEGVINTVNYEITDRDSEMSMTWGEYIQLTVDRVNNLYAKSILLHLSKHNDRYWTPQELKETLNLDLSLSDIQRRLLMLWEGDMIARGSSDIQFRGLQDGTLNLILRNRFGEEIEQFEPDLKEGFNQQIAALKANERSLKGMLNHLSGILAERLLATEIRARKRFKLSDLFQGGNDSDKPLNIIDVKERVLIQRPDGKKMEIDVKASAKNKQTLLVEVKKRKKKSNLEMVEDFQEKIEVYQALFPEETVIPAFLSLGGFDSKASDFCQEHNIATAEEIRWHLKS